MWLLVACRHTLQLAAVSLLYTDANAGASSSVFAEQLTLDLNVDMLLAA